MILYQCLCGSTFVAGKLHKKTGKDGKTKTTYFGSEIERKAKVAWKIIHGTRRGYDRQDRSATLIHNVGHGYTRSQMTKH